MHISKIELENIKSYEKAVFEFEPGTTAIMGENGAGKTTLIEAVAWVLFDLLDYKKDDFLRRGTKRGFVSVEFESGLDERRYVVQRDTRTTYFVYDPRLKTRIADKKEEVTRFLWQHLGVEAGTDLESLFRRAIGVPQGTFTAIFLESPSERKKAFDKLLKVEEYRIGSFKLGQTAKYVELKTLDAIQKVAHAEGELTNLERIEAELKSFTKDSKQLTASMKKTRQEVEKQQRSLGKLEKNKSRFESLKAELEVHDREKERLELVLAQKQKELENARIASEIVGKTGAEHKSHVKALGMIKELERERTMRDNLRTELGDIEKAILSVKAEQKAVKARLDDIEKKRALIADLEPKVKVQTELEAKKTMLEKSVVEKRSAAERVEKLERRLTELRDRHKANEREIKTVESFKETAAQSGGLRAREQQIRTQIAAVRARIDRDREFQMQVEDGMCPIFSAKCLNLKEGDTLDGFLKDRFAELEKKSRELEIEQDSVSKASKKAAEAETAIARLKDLLRNREEILADGNALRKEQDSLKESLAGLERDAADLEKTKSELQELGDPRGQIELLKKDAEHIQSLMSGATKVESNLERLESDRRLKVEHLETYKDLDSNWNEYTKLRDETSEAHREFLKNESIAKSLPSAESDSDKLKSALKSTEKAISKTSAALLTAEKDFDSELYNAGLELLRKNELEFERVSTEAKHSALRKSEIEAEIERLRKTKEQLSLDKKEKERLDRLSEAIAFIRSTLKSAAPRVAKNYVFHVSVEANMLFRDITGNAEGTLRWTDDYGIELEQDGYSRPFVSLSGGEQMSAALAVRLALLKQLSDVKLAFFDEPTTNMDLERRERLAEQISRITESQTFDQLFVISHDDTFESYADHVITIAE